MRPLLLQILVLCGALGLVLGGLLSTAEDSLFDAESFARRSAESLGDPRVAALAANRVTDSVLKKSPDLTAVRPLILATAQVLVSSEPFRAVLGRAAVSAHRAVFAEGTRSVALSLPDVGVLLRSTFEQASPELAERIPSGLETVVASIESGPLISILDGAWALRAELRTLTWALLLGCPLLLLFALWQARDLRLGFAAVGIALVGAGVASWAVLPLGRSLASVLITRPLALAAAQGIWDVFLAPMARWGLFLAGLGVLFAAAGTSLMEAFDPLQWVRSGAARLVTPPRSRAGRSAWGLALLLVGVTVVRSPLVVSKALVIAAGLLAGFFGARELFRVALDSVEASRAVVRVGASVRSLLRLTLLFVLMALLGAAWLVLRRPDAEQAGPLITECNGHAQLCGRSLDEVVFPGAHNAMSNAEVSDWMFPHHQAGIPTQLREGVRALLIDVHYGFPGGSRIKTDFGKERPTIEAMRGIMGEEGVDAALRIRDRLVGVDEGRRGLYLCHGFCELGATELVATLRAIREFLVERPGEVLLIVIEDHVSPEDLEGAFAESGLSDRVYVGPSGPPWPRLRELVESGRNAVVFVESGKPGVVWLRPAFDLIQETPYTFHSPEEFSCRPNRGVPAAGLFQVNHWIETTPAPRPSNAQVVNAHDVLLGRARECQRERGMLPNVLAVDFYRSGDLIGVADELNGVAAESGS